MNESHVSGTLDQAKGKIKQGFGEATGDQEMANSGTMDQVKGNLKQGWGDVKDAVHNLGHTHTADHARAETTETRLEAEHDAHQARNSVAQGAEDLKDSISRGLHNLTHKDKE